MARGGWLNSHDFTLATLATKKIHKQRKWPVEALWPRHHVPSVLMNLRILREVSVG